MLNMSSCFTMITALSFCFFVLLKTNFMHNVLEILKKITITYAHTSNVLQFNEIRIGK